MSTAAHDPACELAHGARSSEPDGRILVAVFDSPVASYLLHFARDLGYATALVDPALSAEEAARVDGVRDADRVAAGLDASWVGPATDVVVTDHDRPELGEVLRDALGLPARWVGVMGSPRHTAPHVAALRALGVADTEIARIHRPIGLNIGSRTPAEIALATLAGLIADRNDRPAGFVF
ncbi:XdhC family protein [Planosporangium mesophilum]|uniref:Xanthine dehydrogenase accessory factor n=1 Tax=Planosporangium mesophilum TaxID=689768 RepID=A0A8J3X1N8_9ACTN|nr:XdhC family protein [Planosporangium mesophilum]NJC85527.1 XdhC/CoxF family protein [Planosporangium mesophilum]GII24607.1 xanthine dehydrogenase accessory factor [Planosporangium mesophilum]